VVCIFQWRASALLVCLIWRSRSCGSVYVLKSHVNNITLEIVSITHSSNLSLPQNPNPQCIAINTSILRGGDYEVDLSVLPLFAALCSAKIFGKS